jgi:hypothetical protein
MAPWRAVEAPPVTHLASRPLPTGPQRKGPSPRSRGNDITNSYQSPPGPLVKGAHSDRATDTLRGEEARILTATPGLGGGWVLRIYEPGGLQRTRHLDDDQKLCGYLIRQVVLLAFPYGWKTGQIWTERLDTGAVATDQWWSAHGNLPDLKPYRQDEGAWASKPPD